MHATAEPHSGRYKWWVILSVLSLCSLTIVLEGVFFRVLTFCGGSQVTYQIMFHFFARVRQISIIGSDFWSKPKISGVFQNNVQDP